MVLKSYQVGLPIPDSINRGLLASLWEGGVSAESVFIEHLDLTRTPSREHLDNVTRLLRHKLQGEHISIAIVEGPPAIDFVANQGKELFPNAALLTLISPNLEVLEGDPRQVMDLPWRVDPGGTLRVALDLFPKTRLVFVITGAKDTVLPFFDQAKKAFAPWDRQLEFEYSNQMTHAQMLQRTATLPADSIIVYSPFFTDVAGQAFVPAEVVEEVVQRAHVPVFATLAAYLGRGIVGGSLLQTETIGRQAGKVALDYLHGRLELKDPVTTFAVPSQMMFDWRELSRWSLSTADVPVGSLLVNRPPSLWREHKTAVLAAAAGFLVLSLLLVTLVIVTRRSTRLRIAANLSEARFRLMIEQAPEAITVYDVDRKRIIDANPEAERLFGCTKGQLLAGGFERFYASNQPDGLSIAESIEGNSQRALAGAEFVVERSVHTDDGRDRLCEVRIVRLPYADQRLLRASFLDITERKRAEEELQKTMGLLLEAEQVARFGHWEWNPQTDAVSWSEQVFHILGLDPQQTTADFKLWFNLIHSDDIPAAQQFISDVSVGSEVVSTTYRVVNRDATIRHLLVRGTTHSDEQGQPVSVRGVVQDITELKEAEEGLLASEEKYRSMVDHIGTGVALISPAMEIIEVNPQMRKWFPNIDPRARPTCYQVFNDPPQDEICSYCPTCKTLKDGKVHETTTATPAAGGIRHYRIVSSPILNPQGGVIAVIEMVDDITERLTLEDQLRQSQKMEALGTLAGGIAHDFNNILGAVLGYTELSLMDDQLSLDTREHLDEVLTAANRAKELVKQILMFSRKGEEKREPIHIHLVVEEAAKLLRQTIPTTIQINLDVDHHTGTVRADATQMHQILMNFGTNAYHAMRERGGELDIRLESVQVDLATASKYPNLHEGSFALLTVTDTGSGMDPITLSRIFDPFFTTKRVGEGTGMGLSVVHGIIQSHGGAIGVESSLGAGTTFNVFLPLVQGEESKALAGADTSPTGDEHILLVDDEPALAKMLGKMLEALRYRVTVATSPREALDRFQAAPETFDLMVTDQTMPEMTGDQLTREVMKVRPSFPVILCTGYSDILDDTKARAMGIRALLMKPVSRVRLAETLRRVLDESV